MNVLFGAVVCALALVLIFAVFVALPALLAGWLRIRSVVVVGKGFDMSLSEEDQEELPEVCERPHVDLLDPLAVYPEPVDETAARIARIKEKMKRRTTPTLPGRGPKSYVPIRAYKDKAEITQNHKLEILNR